MTDEDYINNLKIKREELSKKLEDIAISMANLGKEMYDLKEELRITEIQLKKVI